MPLLPAETVEKYKPVKKTRHGERRQPTFRMVCAAGGLVAGETLTAVETGVPVRAKVTDSHTILLENGEVFESPTGAARRQREIVTGKTQHLNGWNYWQVGESGRTLADVRADVLASETSRDDFLAMFWDGFFDYCDERHDFVDVFGSQVERVENRRRYVDFRIGVAEYRFTAFIEPQGAAVGANLHIKEFTIYEILKGRRDEVERQLESLGSKVEWYEGNEKSRKILVRHTVPEKAGEGDEIYRWLVDALLRLRAVERLAEE